MISIMLFITIIRPFMIKATFGNDHLASSYVDSMYEYNNHCLAGDDLIKIGDKIFFNYSDGRRTPFDVSGTYEISNAGCFRIYSGEGIIEPVILHSSKGIRSFHNQIVKMDFSSVNSEDMKKGKISYLDTFYRTYLEYYSLSEKQLPDDFKDTIMKYEIYNNEIYYFSKHCMYKLKDNKLKKIVEFSGDFVADDSEASNSDDFYKQYITEKFIYCSYRDKGMTKIYSINLETNEEKKLYETDLLSNAFIVKDNMIYLTLAGLYSSFSLYKIDLQNNNEITSLCSDVNSFNICNDKLYVCSKFSLLEIDTNNYEKKEICNSSNTTNEPLVTCHIFDEKWIYFSDSGNCFLYRTNHDGSVVETVFSVK